MKVFFDNCVSHKLVECIRIIESPPATWRLIHLRDRFPPSVPDELWIPELKEEGDWRIVTSDDMIRKRKAQQPLWRGSGLIVVWMAGGWAQLDRWTQASKFLHAWPRLRDDLCMARPGDHFELAMNGRCTKIG
ncbi:MAG: hypothetical protein K8T90_05775 [Planctomycetes bacterium]|nr:hypothetical protein [Planctomycetota bacterium]